jgi:2-keto-4-pentenoate hydratase/2-oxohepta-3-ene-1,7-dioic acid hydratase in catechol pathway
VGIDFTARDIQQECKQKGLPWEKAKAFDNSAVVGKFIDMTPEMKKSNFSFSLKKNDEVVQQGNSSDMIFSFDSIIANVSNYFSLNIGDLIFTGTPAGVGECVVGDVLEAFLDNKSIFSVEVK